LVPPPNLSWSSSFIRVLIKKWTFSRLGLHPCGWLRFTSLVLRMYAPRSYRTWQRLCIPDFPCIRYFPVPPSCRFPVRCHLSLDPTDVRPRVCSVIFLTLVASFCLVCFPTIYLKPLPARRSSHPSRPAHLPDSLCPPPHVVRLQSQSQSAFLSLFEILFTDLTALVSIGWLADFLPTFHVTSSLEPFPPL